METKWNVETLKEHFEQILNEKDKALTAALIAVKEENRKTEVAAEKRFELLNELRGGVATKAEVEAIEKIVDDLKSIINEGRGRGIGLSAGWGYLLGILALASTILSLIRFFIM